MLNLSMASSFAARKAIRVAGMAMGFSHVQSSPLTRSSYHAREAAEAATAEVSTATVPGSHSPAGGVRAVTPR